MGEKRKGRMANNEKTSKKEKKANSSIVKSASNDDIEEQSSMHSNSSNSDSTSQQPSVTQEIKSLEEIDDPQPIETVVHEENIVESNPLIVSEETQPTTIESSTVPTNKSWWSSIVRLFHFGNSTVDSKPQLDSESSTLINENYLSNVKPRRSLHGNPVVS